MEISEVPFKPATMLDGVWRNISAWLPEASRKILGLSCKKIRRDMLNSICMSRLAYESSVPQELIYSGNCYNRLYPSEPVARKQAQNEIAAKPWSIGKELSHAVWKKACSNDKTSMSRLF